MNISKSRRLKFNLGNYESGEVSAQATLTHDDLGFTQEEVMDDLNGVVKAIHAKLEAILDQLMIEDIRSTAELTEEKRSVLLRFFNPPTVPATVARRR